MHLIFATCERHRALNFLKRLYARRVVEDTPESAGPILDFVAKDIIRIGDPDHHNGAVFPSKGTPEQIREAVVALQAFHDRTMATGAA